MKTQHSQNLKKKGGGVYLFCFSPVAGDFILAVHAGS